MVAFFGGGTTPIYRRVMIFIDGAYLRENLRKILGDDLINFTKLSNFLVSLSNIRGLQSEIIRIFYYDAIVDAKENLEEHKKQDEYFEKIRQTEFYEVRLGRLIKTNDKYKQKGVDVLLSIDILSKAYENQFDIAIIVCGDDDFIDVVKSVKDIGKRVYGIYFRETVSKRLIDNFDVRLDITSNVATDGPQGSLLK